MLLYKIPPSQALTDFVRFYRIMDFKFEPAVLPQCKAYRPRIEHCLQFMPRDTERIVYPHNKQVVQDKKAALVGQHNLLNHRYVGNNYLNIQVVFKPGGLYRLTGIPSSELTNLYVDADVILGTDVHLVNEQLYHAGDHRKMISIIESYLSRITVLNKSNNTRLIKAACLMLNSQFSKPLDWYASQACMSYRNFDRRFKEITGITPKEYLGLVKLDNAYLLKNRFPKKDWFSIAVDSGYYDYQHLSRAYKTFTGYTPTSFFELEKQAPERFFGDYEH